MNTFDLNKNNKLMKNLKLALLVAVSLLLGSSALFGQNQKGQGVVGLNLGYSLTGAVASSLGTAFAVDESAINISRIPPIHLTFDYALSDRFSLGVYGGLERITTNISGYSFTNSEGEPIVEDVKGSANRIGLGLRPLFHYGGNENLDLYSGLRIGYIVWTGSADTSDPTFDFNGSLGVNRPSISLILFGMRYYFTDAIGAGFEIATGAPYLANLSVNMKFGGDTAAAPMRGASDTLVFYL